ncbi:MAG TPA: energy transducer TonB [Terriglobales bacterium]|jgi:Gram-negative bacterial TonB protein C-terminal|nr:energy transducer TonB [Terriglobales bacterium]
MLRPRSFRYSLVVAATALLFLPLAAQDSKPAEKPSCIATTETVYQPGKDGVQPPQPPSPLKSKNVPTVRGPVSLELLINSEGRPCEVHVVSARDTSNAAALAEYISEHWTFKPATRKGKAVAVRFLMNWNFQ